MSFFVCFFHLKVDILQIELHRRVGWNVSLKGSLRQRTCQMDRRVCHPVICSNNIGLEMRPNVSLLTLLSRWKPKWMTRQKTGARLKNGGHHGVTACVTSAAQFQTQPFKRSLCLKTTMHLWWKKNIRGSWVVAVKSAQKNDAGGGVGSSLCAAVWSCYVGFRIVLFLNILLQFSPVYWVSTACFEWFFLIHCNEEKLVSRFTGSQTQWPLNNLNISTFGTQAKWHLETIHIDYDLRLWWFNGTVYRKGKNIKNSHRQGREKQIKVVANGNKRVSSRKTVDGPGHTRKQDRKSNLCIGDIRLLMTPWLLSGQVPLSIQPSEDHVEASESYEMS